jgi:hypothetical protein
VFVNGKCVLGPTILVVIWSNPILLGKTISSFVSSALKYNITSLEYEFHEMALTPSCKGIGIKNYEFDSSLQGFMDIKAPNWP